MVLKMEDVALTLGKVPRITKATADTICPNCGNNCLHFDFNKQVFACPCCRNVGGGVIDAWAFFRGIKGADIRETRRLAKKDLEAFYGKDPKALVKNTQKVKYVKPSDIASAEELNSFFRVIINELSLTDKHRNDLRARGMTDSQISLSLIKSYRRISSSRLQELFPGQDLSRYPGFYMKNGKPYMVDNGPGILIPEISIDGEIKGFQIRNDTKEKRRRYITLSSAKYGGASGPTYTHYANWKKIDPSIIRITEGPLKGTLINYFEDIPVLAIPGVNSQKYLKEDLWELKKRGLKEVEIAFDMDLYTNPNVKNALEGLKKSLSDMEIPFVQLKWDKQYKGYDDYLLAKASV